MIFFTPEIVKYIKVKLDKNETSLQGTNFASPLVLCYIEIPLYLGSFS